MNYDNSVKSSILKKILCPRKMGKIVFRDLCDLLSFSQGRSQQNLSTFGFEQSLVHPRPRFVRLDGSESSIKVIKKCSKFLQIWTENIS